MSMPHVRPAATLAVSAVLTLSLAACGGSGSGASGDADRTVYAESATDPTSFDPAAARAGDDFVHNGLLYDTLISRDLDGELSPSLATEWEAKSASTSSSPSATTPRARTAPPSPRRWWPTR